MSERVREFLFRVVYPMVVVVTLVGGTIAMDRVFASPSDRNGGQELYCDNRFMPDPRMIVDAFMRRYPDRRITALLADHGRVCIVHEPVR